MALFVLKESCQLIAGTLRLRKGKMLKGAQITGKICTTVLFLSLILLVMMPNLEEKYVLLVTVIDAFFLLIAFADYIIVYIRKDGKFQVLEDQPNE